MSQERPVGHCQICAMLKPLSFEHIPPKSAFNEAPTLLYLASPEHLSCLPPSTTPYPGDVILLKKGFGAYTLCEKCNNFTGGAYGKYYVSFVKQIYDSVESRRKEINTPTVQLSVTFRPARALKQIIAMFASVYSATRRLFGEDFPELKRILLQKDARMLPSDHAFYAYFLAGGSARFVASALPIVGKEPSSELLEEIERRMKEGKTISEFAFGFLGFVWARGVDSIQLVDQTGLLAKINHWISIDKETTLTIDLPLLKAFPPHLPLQYLNK